MSLYSTVLMSALIISAIIILAVSKKSKKFFTCVFLSAFSGLSGLFAVHVLSWFTPLTLPVNLFTSAVSLVAGIPGVIALLISAVTV